MDRQIDFVFDQSFFNLFYKKSFASHVSQGHVMYFITHGFNFYQLEIKLGISSLELSFNPLGLPEGEGASSCSDRERIFCQKVFPVRKS